MNVDSQRSAVPGLVSVVIPTYNRQDTILRALNSVFTQTYQALEIIVIDDGSTDQTAAIVAPFADRIRYIRQHNQGVSKARNHGIAEASGEFVAFLDSDDEWLPTKIEKQVRLFQENPQADFVGCMTPDEEMRIRDQFDTREGQFLSYLMGMFPANPTRHIVRRKCLVEHGDFDSSLNGGEDLDLWLRLLQRGCLAANVPEMLLVYHISDDGLSRNVDRMLRDQKFIKRRHIDSLPSCWQRLWYGSRFLARCYRSAAISLKEQGRLWESSKYFARSILVDPVSKQTAVRFAGLVSVGLSAIRSAR